MKSVLATAAENGLISATRPTVHAKGAAWDGLYPLRRFGIGARCYTPQPGVSPSLLGGLAGDAEPGADLRSGVAAGSQALD